MEDHEHPDMGVWILTGPLQEQQVLAITAPSLQPLVFLNLIKGGIYSSMPHGWHLFIRT